MKLKITVKNQQKLKKKLKEVGRKGVPILAQAMYVEAEMIMLDSKVNYVPVDTGALRSTGIVTPPKIEGRKVTVELSFGGPARGFGKGIVGYAVFVHEDMGGHSYRVGGPFYLTTPLKKASRGMSGRLAKAISMKLKGAIK
jgi:hypothetical protein